MYKKLLNKLDIIEPLIKATDNPELMNKAKFLYDRISNPDSYVVMLGETSSGKSSILNGLIGRPFLPVKASPSTASVAEIVFKYNIDNEEFYSITKNAKMKKISESEFFSQCEEPGTDVCRLRAHLNTSCSKFNNLRIFDTPGYDSIVDEHEEILKNFLPNSDFVIYTVSYKVGIQDYDYSFLSFLRELIRDDVKIVLLINRCPSGIDFKTNPRIKEIKSYVSDLLTIDPQVFYIENIVSKDDNGHAMPECKDLWNYIESQINCEDRKRILYEAFDGYIYDLYKECDNIIQIKYKESLLNDNELRKIRITQREFAENIRNLTKELVEPTFEHIKSKLPQKINETEIRINNSIIQKISEADRLGKDEMVAYTNSHLIPFTIKKEMGEVIQFIDIELSDLNKKLEDYIQKEIVKFNDKVKIILDTNLDNAVKNIAQEYVKRMMGNALSEYFLQYAGAAGLRGGVANAASHSLKVVGDFFGKVFRKHTHEMVQRIGANLAKGLGAIIAIITETLFELYDIATWKNKLCKKVEEGVGKWKEETIPMVTKDLEDLKEINISTLYDIAKHMEDGIEDTASTNLDECINNVKLSELIKGQLEY